MALRTPLTAQPHLYIGDSTGRPLDYGRVYFGEPNKDPEFYPIDIYLDPEMTIAAAQPVRTKGGFMDVGGNLAELHAAEVVYSLKVLDRYGRQVFYKPEMYRNNVSDFLVDEITRATAAETLIAGNLTAETQRAVAAEKLIADAVVTEKDRAIAAEDALDIKHAALLSTINSLGGGKKAYTTYALMVADKNNIAANSSIDVTNDTDPLKNGTYSYNGAVFTKSIYDVETIVRTKVLNTFKTKSLMDASALPDGADAQVTNDTANNGLYVKTAGAWVKSAYDPAATAKDYTDDKISKLNSYTVNTNKPFPMVKNPISGYTSLGSSLIYSMIVDAEIKNADPNYYYKISYFANGATNYSALGNGVQVDKVLKTKWDVETQHVNDSILLSGARTAQDFVLIKNSGLQKVKLNLERSTYKEEVTIVFDTDHPSFLNGVAISANTRSQAGYDYSLSPLRVFKEVGTPITPDPVDPTTPSSSPFAGKKLVCFGDSITEFGNYPELIKQRLGLAESYNVGFGGARFAKHSDDGYIQMSMFKLAEYIAANDFTELLAAAERLATSAVADDNRPQAALLASIDFTTVDYISIFYGTNDAKNRALGDDSDYSAGGNTFKAAINYTLQKIMTKHPHIKVLLVTPYFSSRGDIAGGSDTNPNTLGVYLSDYVDAINRLGAQNKVPVLDMLRTSGINRFNSAHYLVDGLHPTLAGTQLIADKIASKLSATY